MNIDKKIYIVEQLIQDSNSDLAILLSSDTFIKYAHSSDVIAIDFIVQNTHQLMSILFQDYQQINSSLYQIYSQLISRVWGIIDLNFECILQEIEKSFIVVYDLLKYNYIPDVQWAQALKIFLLIQQRSQQIIIQQLDDRQYLLNKFLKYLDNNSVAQIILIFLEHDYHPQKLQFIKQGFLQFNNFDSCQAINFTFLIHEIITRIVNKELLEYLYSKEVIQISTNIFKTENIDFIVRKNAAHIISLISNYYSMDMQNIYLDEPYSETIVENFRKTDFFQTFEIQSIKDVLNNTLKNSQQIGLLSIKLVEIIDNLVRITDIELWKKVNDSQIMEIILNLVKKFNHSDIFISYVCNMITFILDRVISDFHPFWCVQLLSKYKLHTQQIKQFNRLILIFEQQLAVKLIRDSDFLPYYDELKLIESILKRSQIWKNIKQQLEYYEDKHKFRLGEDSETPSRDSPLIVSAINEDFIDEIIEPQMNGIFLDCFNKISPYDSLKNNEDDSEDNDDQINLEFQGIETLNKLKNVFQQMDLKEEQENQQENQQTNTLNKKFRNLSSSLNNDFHKNQQLLTRSLKNDNEKLKKMSMSTSTNIKILNQNFEWFQIINDKDKKVLKSNNIIKVDEMDF